MITRIALPPRLSHLYVSLVSPQRAFDPCFVLFCSLLLSDQNMLHRLNSLDCHVVVSRIYFTNFTRAPVRVSGQITDPTPKFAPFPPRIADT